MKYKIYIRSQYSKITQMSANCIVHFIREFNKLLYVQYFYMYIHDPLTVHIMKISNPLRSEGVLLLLVEAVTSFIGGGS